MDCAANRDIYNKQWKGAPTNRPETLQKHITKKRIRCFAISKAVFTLIPFDIYDRTSNYS